MITGASCEWIEVDPGKLDLPQEDKSAGDVRIRIFVSPYDVPEAIRGCWDEDTGVFVLEFRYLDSEPWKTERSGPVRIRLGKHSKRIRGIEVNTSQLGADLAREEDCSGVLSKTTQSALEQLVAGRSTPRPENNYKLAKDLVEKLGSKLFPHSAAAGVSPLYAL